MSMIFKNDLHSSQGKSERIDWIKEEIKKFTLTDELAKRNVNVINNKIEDCLRLLRLSPNTRKDYRDQILSLWQKCKLIKTWNDPNKDIDRKLKVKDDLFLVIEYNNLIIGSAMAGYDGHRGYVYYLAIDPIHQNKGLGKLLMDNIEKKLKEIGCPKINIFIRSANINVKNFYKSIFYD